ncbi:MAG TPA: SURF1 family protein [Alphaproteobacteria bacterium]|nr:SURF1 family protein [Alphaproteobacteria bacterium]
MAVPFVKRFRPTFWPTVLMLPMLAVLIGLGSWQLQRLEWKTGILATIDERIEAPPEPMPAAFDDPEAWNYRRVRVEGRFLHDRELFLAGRTFQGRAGYQIMTPLVRTDAAQQQVVLVNRGWIPSDRRDPATRPESRPEGIVAVDGILRLPPPRGWMQPDNATLENVWYWTDLPAMAEAAGVADPPPLILEAGPGEPETLPIGGQTRINIPNDHLQYALTWYSFAVILLVIYVIYHLRPPNRPLRKT